MKKILICVLCGILLCGCNKNTATVKESEQNTNSFRGSKSFKVIEKFNGGNNLVIYDTKTKVMYLVLNDSRYTSAITPLYNADGSLRTYDGK